MPAAGAHFTVACFNLPAIDPPRPRGIFVVFLVDDAKIVASSSSDKTPLCPAYEQNAQGVCRPGRREPTLTPDVTFEVKVRLQFKQVAAS